MSADLPLSPRGTARQRLSPAPAYPPALAEELRDADVETGEEALYLAWQVASWAEPADRDALLTLFARTLWAVAQGSTRLFVEERARALLARAGAVVGGPGERKPFVLDGDHLYPQRLLAAEHGLAAALRARLGQPGLFAAADVARAVASATEGVAAPPTEEQAAAVSRALSGRFAVITGGPGTGKTTIALTLVRALLALGVAPRSIALAAPTGKAANRLDETLRAGLAEDAGVPAALTLHRLLGYSPRAGAFQYGEGNRLPCRAVIVDESSMIDLALMERLARAVPADALLVLMGDADQLPSVETGAVFRDLAPLGVALTRNFRMDPARPGGRAILEVAGAVRTGDTAALAGLIAEVPSGQPQLNHVEIVPAAGREELLERWYHERAARGPTLSRALTLQEARFVTADEERLAGLHAHYQSFRVLCLTRRRPTGVEVVNAWLHRRNGATSTAYLPGEPILMLRNDYERGLFNGDQGLVVRARDGDRPPRLMAAFPVGGRWQAWDLESVREVITLAYAMTVHKAQGSEYDDVALLLPDTPIPLLSRELLYTALTRARRSVTICGAPAVLAAGASRPLVRSSGVGEKLGG
jgi:exodeoxyribonuclease V alpha subunit